MTQNWKVVWKRRQMGKGGDERCNWANFFVLFYEMDGETSQQKQIEIL